MNPWVQRFQPRPAATSRLICFSFAGGTAAVFRPWVKSLPEAVELVAIQLPGRWNRIGEPPFRRMAPLIEALTPALEGELGLPFTVVGYSLGALIAFEWMRAIQAPARHFFALARGAPDWTAPMPELANLSDAAFLNLMRENYGGVPEAFFVDPEFRALFLPALRADMELLQSHRYSDGAGLTVPVTAFAGMEDSTVPADALDRWAHHTSGSFRVERTSGGHFVLEHANAFVLEQVVKVLA